MRSVCSVGVLSHPELGADDLKTQHVVREHVACLFVGRSVGSVVRRIAHGLFLQWLNGQEQFLRVIVWSRPESFLGFGGFARVSRELSQLHGRVLVCTCRHSISFGVVVHFRGHARFLFRICVFIAAS